MSLRQWLALAVGLALLAIVLVSLTTRQIPGPYTPEVAGVVVATPLVQGHLTQFSLDNGQTFVADMADGNAHTTVYQAGAAIGDLLLGGGVPGRPWLALVAPTSRTDLPGGCFELPGWGTDEGSSIQTDIGLRLRKAVDFEPELLPLTPGGPIPTPYVGRRYEATLQVFCLNRAGEVTLRDWGLWPVLDSR